MLDSLGSTLTQETVEGYYTSRGVDPHEGELTVEQIIQSLELEVQKTSEEKKDVGPQEEPLTSGASTPTHGMPSLDLVDKDGVPNPNVALGVSGPSAPPSQEEAAKDPHRAGLKGNGPSLGGPLTGNGGQQQQPGPGETEETTVVDDLESEEEDDETKEDGKERVINIKTCPLCHRSALTKRAEVDIVTHLAVSSVLVLIYIGRLGLTSPSLVSSTGLRLRRLGPRQPTRRR